MNSPFLDMEGCIARLLVENVDPNGKHIEYRNMRGEVFANLVKVYKKGGLFNLFPADNHVHAELRNMAKEVLLTTTSYRGDTARECKVEINAPDGTLAAIVYDAPFGVDFESAVGALLGTARRSEELDKEPREVLHTYRDGSQQTVGTCDRRFPDQSDSLLDALTGADLWGQPIQQVTLSAAVDPALRTLLFLFPGLQHLRFSRNW